MSADLIAHLQDVASDFGALSARRMFGGHGIYHDGVMIGLISDDVLYLKVDDQTRERFRAADSGPFMYTRRGETVPTSYWSVPEAAMDSPQDMKPWLRLAYEAALRKANAPSKKRKAATTSKGTGAAKQVAGTTTKSKPKPTANTGAKPKSAPKKSAIKKAAVKKAASKKAAPKKARPKPQGAR